MMLVDKKIKELVEDNDLIVNFDNERLGAISYDIIIDKFVIDNVEVDRDEYLLNGSKFIYVKAYESLNMTNDLCCKVIEKNSLMRRGLKVDGPLYQPGHKTSIFIRVWNMSDNDILIKKGMSIAQLVFLKLDNIPLNTYDKQATARYNNEDTFRS